MRGFAFKPDELDLISAIRLLWIDNAMWTRSFVVSTVDGLRDLPSVTKRALQNPRNFNALFSGFYGTKTSAKFLALMETNLIIFAQLANALNAGDSAVADQARTKWVLNSNELAAYLSATNPFWEQDEWNKLLGDYMALTEQQTVLRIEGKYDEEIDAYYRVQNAVLKMADYMAQGLIEQFKY